MDSNRPRNVYCLFIFFTVITSVNPNSCPTERACQGSRPRTPNGCCPTPPGGFCGGGGEKAGQCDEGLGFSCVETSPGEEGGLCKGPFGLQAGEVTYTSIQLSWQDFAPPSYIYEYIVFWTTNMFTTNMTDWHRDQVGRDSPSAGLGNLEPDTLYFIRIGTWKEPSIGEYTNLSEVIMTRTLDGCQLEGGIWLAVGEERITGCETICECVTNGNLSCADLCPARIRVNQMASSDCVQIPAGEDYESCCTNLLCSDGSCISENGTHYNNNTRYETECETCLCVNGNSLCTERIECEETDTVSCQRRVPLTSDDCCPRYKCVSECEDGNVTYEHGDVVIRGCNERCVCENGWIRCENICPELDLTPTPDCPYPIRRFPPSGRCAARYCAASQLVDCVINGVPQPIGAERTDEHCQTCSCPDEHSYRCGRGCFTDLGAITASPACPTPQFVHLEGECCPQIWCQENRSPTDSVAGTIRLPKVKWLTKDSFWLTFTVPKMRELEEAVLGYDILYSDIGSAATTDTWTKVFRSANHPGNTSVLNSSYMNMSNVRWVGNDTVRTVVSGVKPGPAYLVRVRIHLDASKFDPQVSNSTTAAVPVISTPSSLPLSVTAVAPPISGYKCWVKDRYIGHGEQHQDGCDVICRCRYGELSCVPLCPVDPPTCPRAAPSPISDQCCGRSKCYGKPGCCRLGNSTIEDGDLVRERCERYCRCSKGSLNCWPVCSAPSPPHPGCVKVYYEDRCCPLWHCPAEKKPPSAMLVIAALKVVGVCDEQNEQFLQQLVDGIITALRQDGLCEFSENSTVAVCSPAQIAAYCPQFAGLSRHRRHTGSSTILVLITIKALNKNDETNFTAEAQLDDAVARLRNVTSRGMVLTVGNTSYPVMTSVDVTDRSILCNPGYLKYDGGCMAGHVISVNHSVSYHVVLTSSGLTESTARLDWSGLPHTHLQYLTALVLEYRDITANGSWLASAKLHVSTRGYQLTGLSPAHLYLTRLLLLTSGPTMSRYTAAVYVFRTHHIKEVTGPEILGMEVGESSVTVRWTELSSEDRALTKQLFVAYCKVPAEQTSGLPFHRSEPLSTESTQYTLQGLLPDTIYKVKVGMVLSNGTTVFSLPADVRTKKEPQEGVIIGVSVVAALAVAALLTLICCIVRRSPASFRLSPSSSETNFENKLYDVDDK